MRRETKNKKVLQAITIGLSTMLATMSMPVNVLAADGDNPSETPAPVVEPSTGATSVADNAQTEAPGAADAIDKAVTDSNEAAQAVTDASKDDATADIKIESGDTKQDPNGTGTYTDTLVDEAKDEAITNPSGVITGTDGINDDLEQLEVYDAAAEAEINKADTAADGLEKDADTLKDSTDQALTNAQNEVGTINTATTIAEANTANANLQKIATDTATEFDAALVKYEAELKAYNDKVAYIAQLEAGYNAELKGTKDGVDDLNTKLATAKAEAEELKIAADNARKNLNQNAQNMLEIDRLITVNNTDSGTNWQKTDGLRDTFKKVMVYYYLPNMQGLSDEEKEAIANLKPEDVKTVSGKNAKGGTDDTRTYHYVEVNGKKLCFNYKLLNGKSGTEIVIFEKRDVEIDDSDVAFDEFDKYKNEAGKAVDINDGSVVAADSNGDGENDVFIQTFGTGTTETLISAGQDLDNEEDTQTRVTTLGEEETVSYSYDDNGNLVKTVTKGVTTVTYTKKSTQVSVDSGAVLSDEDAKKALENQLKTQLGEGIVYDNVSVGDVTATETWEATGSYKPVFEDKIDIHTDFDRGFDGIRYDADDIRTEMEKQSQTLLNAALNEKGQTLVGNPEYQVHTVDESYYEEVLDYYILAFIPVYKKVRVEKFVDYSTTVKLEDTKIGDGKWFRYWTAERTVDYEYTNNSIAAQNVTGTGTSEQEAIANFKTNVASDKSQNYSNAVGVKTNAPTSAQLVNTKYSALLTYWEKVLDSEKTEDMAVSQTTFTDENTSKLTGSIIQNKIYYDYVEGGVYHTSVMTLFDDDTKFTSDNDKQEHTVEAKDWGLNKELQSAKDLKAKYEALYSKANAAYEEYDNALKEVKDLSNEINKIPQRNTELFNIQIAQLSTMELDTLIEYLENQLAEYDESEDIIDVDENNEEAINQKELINSLRSLLEAANNLRGIQGQLTEAEGALTETIARLTPPPAAGPGTTGEGAGDVTPPGAPVAIPLAAAIPGAGLPGGAGAGAGAGAPGGAGAGAVDDADATTIEDEDVPQAAPENEEQDADQDTTTIQNEDVPKSDALDKETVGWWWWLLIVLLGATGVEMYRRHHNKTKQKATVNGKKEKK